MRRDNIDLTITAAGTAAAAAVLLLTEVTGATGTSAAVLRVLAGVPLVLVLPGYALSTLVVPVVPVVPAGSGWPGCINPLLWRSMWATGLSLAVAVLGGLMLNLTPAGLTRLTWTTSLAAVTMLAVAASAWLRARRAPVPVPVPVPVPAPVPVPGSLATHRRPAPASAVAGYALAALAVTGTAIGLAVASAGWQHSPGFAQLWLVPVQSSAASGGGAGSQATLGVRSGYPHAETFHLVLRRGAQAIGTWDFTLTAGQTWQRTVLAPAGQHLAAQLTTAGQSAAESADITQGSAA
jgi:Protein of unknown function (DUF1616)